MSSQKQCHRMRRFEKELSKRYRDVFDRIDYLERRPLTEEAWAELEKRLRG